MALGEKLHKARLARNETVSQVAAATQMTAQSVEDIEQENFTRLSAPIYAKGFIKLYARHVGLDPQPLVQEYMTRFAHSPKPSLLRGESERTDANLQSSAPAHQQEPAPTVPAAKPVMRPAPAVPSPSQPPPADSTVPDEPLVDFAGLRSTGGDIMRNAASALRQGWDSVRKGRHDLRENLRRNPWLRNRPAGSWLKYIPLALGVLLILIFLISSLSRICSKKPAASTRVPLNEKNQEIHLVIDPPAPYFQ